MTTSTGNSNRSIFSRRMKSSDSTSAPMAPSNDRPFMKRPKASSTKEPPQTTALDLMSKNRSTKARPSRPIASSLMIQSRPSFARNTPSMSNTSAPTARTHSGRLWATAKEKGVMGLPQCAERAAVFTAARAAS